jgi:hypothetical protein
MHLFSTFRYLTRHFRFLPLGAGAVVEISTSSKEAAVLLLPDGASRVNLRPLKEFRDYAIKHAQRWYEFVNGNLRRMVENGDLYLVTGMDKTSSWSIAAAENQSEDGRISLTLKAAQVGAAHASYIWEWEAASSFAACGPRRPPEEQSWGQNQTVFLRGYKVAIRSIPLKKSAKALSIVNSKASDILSKSGSVPFSGPPSGSGFGSFFRGAPASGQGSASDDMGSPPSSDSSGASDKEELVEYFPHTTKVCHFPSWLQKLISVVIPSRMRHQRVYAQFCKWLHRSINDDKPTLFLDC